MRSVTFHLIDTDRETVAACLSEFASGYPPNGRPETWAYPCEPSDQVILIYDYKSFVDGYEEDEAEEFLRSLGKFPDVSMIADVSGKVSGMNEVRELIERVLGTFRGVVQDDYTIHCWTLEEIRSGFKAEEHPFFDTEGWDVASTRKPPLSHHRIP